MPESEPDFERLALGTDTELFEIDTSEQNRRAAAAMARQARRSVVIMTRHLDAAVYDQPEFSDAVRDLVVRSRRAEVRVLVKDSTPVLRDGHRLISLAQRLTSFMEIRVPARDHADFNEAFLLVDNVGYIHRNFSDRFEATFSFNDSKIVRGLGREFDSMWELALPDPSLRRLSL